MVYFLPFFFLHVGVCVFKHSSKHLEYTYWILPFSLITSPFFHVRFSLHEHHFYWLPLKIFHSLLTQHHFCVKTVVNIQQSLIRKQNPFKSLRNRIGSCWAVDFCKAVLWGVTVKRSVTSVILHSRKDWARRHSSHG